MFKYLLVFLTFLVSLSPATAAETYAIRGNSATIYAFDNDGCVARTRFLILTESAAHFGPNGASNSKLLLFVENYYDVCNQVIVANLRGIKNLERNEFDLRNGYARVTTTLDMSDSVSGTSWPLNVDLTWVGDGERLKDRTHYRQVTPGLMVVGRYLEFFELATVTGSIGAEVVNTTGDLQTTRYGEVSVETKQ